MKIIRVDCVQYPDIPALAIWKAADGSEYLKIDEEHNIGWSDFQDLHAQLTVRHGLDNPTAFGIIEDICRASWRRGRKDLSGDCQIIAKLEVKS